MTSIKVENSTEYINWVSFTQFLYYLLGTVIDSEAKKTV